MPWGIDDVDKHKKGLDAGQKKLWIKVANRHRQDCIDKGGDDGSCDGGAIRAANAMVDRAKEAEQGITGIARSAMEIALATVNETEEIDKATAKQLLSKLADEFNEYLRSDGATEEPATDLGIDASLVETLIQIASGKGKTDQDALAKLQGLGLVTETGGLNTYGRAVLKASKNEDVDEIERVMGLAEAKLRAEAKNKEQGQAEVAEVGRRLNQQRVKQMQGIIDSLQAKLKDLEDMIGWASYADQEQEEEPERKTLPWATPAAEVAMAEAVMKIVGGKRFPAGDFLVIESPENPSTWHLQIKRNGTPDHNLMGGAKAALTVGYQGNKYEGPNKQKAISKLKALYQSEKMPWLAPSKEVDNMEKEQIEALIAALAEDGVDLDAARLQAQALRDSLSAPEAEPEVEDAEGEPAVETEAAPEEAQEAETAEAETVEADLSESGGEAGILGLAAETQAAEGVNPDRAPLGVYVNVIKPGWGNQKDNRYYPPEMLKRDAGVFEGAKMYTSDHRGAEKSERTEVSVIEQCPVYFAEDGSPVALARIFDPDFAEKTRNRARAGQLQTLRCSIYAKGSVKPGFEQGGRKGDLVEAIKAEPRPDVDWVTRDGAGGHAVAMAESEPEPEPLAQEAVEAALAETNLPKIAKDWVAEGTYADEAQLQEAVGKAVERIKKLTGSGEPFGQGGSKPLAEQGMTDEEYDAAYQARIQEHYHLSQ